MWGFWKEYHRGEVCPSHSLIVPNKTTMGHHGACSSSSLGEAGFAGYCLPLWLLRCASPFITPFGAGVSYLCNTIKFLSHSLHSLLGCPWHPWLVGWCWCVGVLVCVHVCVHMCLRTDTCLCIDNSLALPTERPWEQLTLQQQWALKSWFLNAILH